MKSIFEETWNGFLRQAGPPASGWTRLYLRRLKSPPVGPRANKRTVAGGDYTGTGARDCMSRYMSERRGSGGMDSSGTGLYPI